MTHNFTAKDLINELEEFVPIEFNSIGSDKLNEEQSIANMDIPVEAPQEATEEVTSETDMNEPEKQAPEVVSPIPKANSNTHLDWVDDFTMSNAEMAKAADAHWLYQDLIIQGHIVAIIAPPNGGKTTVMMWVCSQLPKHLSVNYVNADTSLGDAKVYQEQAQSAGINLLLPDLMVGKNMDSVLYKLIELNNTDTDLSNVVFIFDTLKKMADVINKNMAKKLYSLLRSLTGKGMTVVLLGHTNKYPDSNGNLIYEGTGDLRSDVDDLIYLYPVKRPDGSLIVSTQPDKERGSFKPITFMIDSNRNVSHIPYIDTAKESQLESLRAIDNEIIEAVNEALDLKLSIQKDIVEHIKDELAIGARKIIVVLKRYSGDLWQCSKGAKNSNIYSK